MTDTDLSTFKKILGHFDNAMLVTRRGSELRSRPMRIGDTTDDGRIRFITRDDSAKLAELEDDDSVNISLQADSRFLSISGNARLSKDPDLVDSAWRSDQADWFLKGKDDPSVIALEVVPTHAEYWDRSEDDVVSFVSDRLRAAVGDMKPDDADDSDESHGDIDFKSRSL